MGRNNDDSGIRGILLGLGVLVGAGVAIHKWMKEHLQECISDGQAHNKQDSGTSERQTFSSTDCMASHLKVLGHNPGATVDDIKTAYRELSKKFHPDVISGKGLDEEFVQFATRRFQQIQESYGYLMEHI